MIIFRLSFIYIFIIFRLFLLYIIENRNTMNYFVSGIEIFNISTLTL